MARTIATSVPSLSSSPVADEAPWLAMYTPSTGSAAASRRRTRSRKSRNTSCTIGPPGGAAIITSGTGTHAPLASIAA